MNDLQTKEQGLSISTTDIGRLMLFDLSIYGHHPGYIQYLLTYWHQQKYKGDIVVLVSPRFLSEHADVVEYSHDLDSERIQFIAISQAEEESLKNRSSGLSRNWRNFQEWVIFCRYATQLQVDHAMIMYYDTYQYPLALRLNPPCRVSGIYFRPTFHYPYFSQPAGSTQSLKSRWEKFMLSRVLSNSKVSGLLTLDPFVSQYASRIKHIHKLTYLPDPVPICEYSSERLQEIKASLSLDPDRKLFLLFGALSDRKGIYQLLEALALLPAEACEKIAIALIGEAAPIHRSQIERRVSKLLTDQPIEVYCKYEFLPEADVQAYYEVSDCVLALYQNHVGMSGILNMAAAKQKPVLSSNYGLMGELVKQYQLGLAVDSTEPRAIAAGLQTLIDTSEVSQIQQQKMQQFAAQNHADKFAAAILNHIASVT